jgi:DNA repair exonuclease SbcCD ATPase subunit
MTIENLMQFYDDFKESVVIEETKFNSLNDEIDKAKQFIAELEENKNDHKHAYIFIKLKAADTRKKAIEAIEAIATLGIKQIYGEDYAFMFKMKDYNTKDVGEQNYNYTITPTIRCLHGGQYCEFPLTSCGGGLCETVSMLIRLAVIEYKQFRGLIALDESLSGLSADDKLDQLISFLDNYIKDSESQFMLISHRPVEFAKISNKNFLVSKDREDDAGVARVNPVSYEELKSIYDKN